MARFEGRNLDEALEHASAALGVPRFQVEYSVVVEKRGFLGGIKRIVIEAEADPDKQPPEELVRASTAAAMPGARRERPRESRGGGGGGRGPRRREGRGESRGEGRGRGRRDDRGGRREERGGGEPRYRPRRSHLEDEAFDETVPPQESQTPEAAAVAEWVKELIVQAELELEVRTFETEETIEVRLYGADGGLLVERGGELLDSIQVIATKAAPGRATDKKLEFDARGFKGLRSDDLAQKAREMADLVRAEGHEVLLPAMSPVERRIVHLTLQEDGDVETVSRGEGFYKRVAIVPRGTGTTSGES